eukprot:CAMPEP_0116068742 /NCGR_PEP_ID=MMETSP0322-20121206/11851_1 /TAXON_ID=163516 /ORGANISM="Leptocylindrus danicus var. apora, Strain B651" /LENGTH=570 /DNA_ID=CAMNT_0003555929 /DNA_START=97 /DNA_END=1810 /DNA_ORIENTATION=-
MSRRSSSSSSSSVVHIHHNDNNSSIEEKDDDGDDVDAANHEHRIVTNLMNAFRGVDTASADALNEKLPLPVFSIQESDVHYPKFLQRDCISSSVSSSSVMTNKDDDDDDSSNGVVVEKNKIQMEDEWNSPSMFHKELCDRIRQAKERVIIATLYIGSGTASNATKEREFLDVLEDASKRGISLNILMDAARGLRPIRIDGSDEKATSSCAESVYKRITRNTIQNSRRDTSIYLFNAIYPILSLVLPSPLDEVAGVFHMKVYIIDDCLILSGANLSEEYFTDRQDRFMTFVNGAGGLVDFYADLVKLFCKRSNQFSLYGQEKLIEPEVSLNEFVKSINNLFLKQTENHVKDVVAYVVPTIQLPNHMITNCRLRFQNCSEAQNNALSAAMIEKGGATSIRMATAYCNPTESYKSILRWVGAAGNLYILTAGGLSHGFAPKKGRDNGKGRAWIPDAFSNICYELNSSIKSGGMLYWERKDWTFHSKGLWFSAPCNDQKKDCISQCLYGTIIGSSNFNQRSENFDVESNTGIFFKPDVDASLSQLGQHQAETGIICYDFLTKDKVQTQLEVAQF